MCEALVKQGVDLELVVPRRKNVFSRPMQEFYGLKTPIKVKKLFFLNFGFSNPFSYNLSSFSFAFSYFFYLFSKRLKGEKAIFYSIDLDEVSYFIAPILGWPVFYEMHDTKRKRFLYSYFFKRVKGIITISDLIKEDLIKKFGIPKEKILVFPNGIDLDFFAPAKSRQECRRILRLSQNRPMALYCGKIYDWKGLEILVGAAAKKSECDFCLIGGSGEELQKSIGIEKIPANMVCAGQRDYKEVSLWYGAADVLLVLGTKQNPYSYYYTSPMKIFEYMAANRPIVASATPALKQIVSREEVFFYEPDDVASLAEAVGLALNSSETACQKIRKASEKVKRFEWSRRAENILNFIESNQNGSNG